MAGVTEYGFETKTYQEIFDENTANANSDEYFGEDFPTTVDSAFGILNAIFSAALKASGWDQAEAVYNQFNRDKAEGKNLDDLAALVGMERIEEGSSTGNLFFIGTNSKTIPKGLSVEDNNSSTVLTATETTYDKTACYYTEITVSNVANATEYVVYLDNDTYSYTSTSDATEEEIIEALEIALATADNATASISDDSTTLYITCNSENNGISVIVNSDLVITKVGMIVGAEASETGELTFSAGTLTGITTPGDAVGTDSVTNLSAFELGNDEETDAELRLRMSEGDDSSDAANVSSMQTAIEELDDVSDCTIFENITMSTDEYSRPAKSFECLVTGGLSQDIGDKIWAIKPIGIESYGNTEVLVEDANGDTQTVYFSRATPKYASIKIEYTLYSEEDFPTDGEATMLTTAVEYGKTLGTGEDIIPQRFTSKIFNAVDGLESVTTYIGISDDESTTPTYYTTKIAISQTEISSFSSDRATVEL